MLFTVGGSNIADWRSVFTENRRLLRCSHF